MTQLSTLTSIACYSTSSILLLVAKVSCSWESHGANCCYYYASLEFTVALDSGSSDLWVMPDPDKPLKISNSTGLYLPLTYGKGVANGTLEFAELKLGNYTIPSQGVYDRNVLQGVPLNPTTAFFNVNEVRVRKKPRLGTLLTPHRLQISAG